jgi:hypothetical protein
MIRSRSKSFSLFFILVLTPIFFQFVSNLGYGKVVDWTRDRIIFRIFVSYEWHFPINVSRRIKKIHHSKTNKWDATVDALQVRKRIEHLTSENCERDKRNYTKSTNEYWSDIIFQQRAAKKAKISVEMSLIADKYIFRIFISYEWHFNRNFSLFCGSLLKNYITPILVRTFGVVSLKYTSSLTLKIFLKNVKDG